MSDPSADFAACFQFVRGAYRTASRLLRAAEPAMSERAFRPYYDWDVVWPEKSSPGLDDSDRWLRTWANRQFYRDGHKDSDVFTLSTVFFDLNRPGFRPMLIGSRMTATGATDNEIYRLGQVQRWSEHPADGVVRWIGVTEAGVPGFLREREGMIVGGRVLSVAIPLLEATDIESVERRVIDPVLAQPWNT